MRTNFLLTIKTQFCFLHKSTVNQFLHGNMYRAVCSCGVFVYAFMFHVFGFVIRQIFRIWNSKTFEHCEPISSAVHREPDDHQIGSGWCPDTVIHKTNGEREISAVKETASSVRTSKYEFLSGKGISAFVEEPKTLSFTVHQVFEDPHSDEMINNSPTPYPGGYADDDFREVELEAEDLVDEGAQDIVENVTIDEFIEYQEEETLIEDKCSYEEDIALDSEASTDEEFGKIELDSQAFIEEKAEEAEEWVPNFVSIEEFLDQHEHETFIKEKSSEKGKIGGLEDTFEVKHDSSDQVQFVSTCCSLPRETKEEFTCSSELYTSNDHTDPSIYEILANRTNSESFAPQSPEFIDEEQAVYNRQPEAAITIEHVTESDDEYIELEPQKHNSILMMEEEKQEQADLFHKEAERTEDFAEGYEEPSWTDNKCFSNSDVQDDMDFMLEHQDIIEQLKMELKLARTGGLPTILEESEPEELETPKIVPELKQLKIDEKFEHKDLVNEIQKVYRSYLDKMRKLDIFNFQTMHAVGLLQLKDTVGLQIGQKSSRSGKKYILSQNLWSCKQGVTVLEPALKIVADMQKDFEVVYVGQLCLSWEILHWQFRKVHELQKHDHQEFRQYNQVAGEFQLFQVLLHRFIENEPFQGPRVQNYAKNRCVLHNVLQVPVIKDDSCKDKGNGDVGDPITSQMLEEIVEESMQVFWEFLHADKEESNLVSQSHEHPHANPRDTLDGELVSDIRTNLHKKEKKLKDILRSGNCIVKRFQKKQDNDRVHHSLFVAQVELKLVSRVLKMPKLTTDQLIWCHEKLDKINISNRKVFVEPSFLLFPC